jgi:tRNA 2-thiouridine synthesizing protein B
MSILHTISKPPGSGLFESCNSLLKAGDCVLFIEDGAYHCLDGSPIFNTNADVKFSVLVEDAQARGLVGRLSPSVATTDTSGFVELCVRFEKIVNWF